MRPSDLALRGALSIVAVAASVAFAQAPSPETAAEPLPEVTAPPMAVQPGLPRAPEGFVWRHFEGAVFLHPLGWNERTAVGPVARAGTHMKVYASSPEAFSAESFFEMGLTLQVVKDSKKLTGVDASTVALLYIKPFLDATTREEVLMADRTTNAGIEYTYFRYRNAPAGQKPIVVHKFVAAVPRLDAVFAFTFESPEATWKENWERYGTPILKSTFFLRPPAPSPK